MTTETCPNPAHDPRELAPNRVLCDPCWHRLDATMKAEVFTARRAYLADRTSGAVLERYTDIIQTAVKEVNEP